MVFVELGPAEFATPVWKKAVVGLRSFSSLTVDPLTTSCIRFFLEGEGLLGAVSWSVFLGVLGARSLVSWSKGGGVDSRAFLL